MTNSTELRRSIRAALDHARQGHLQAFRAAVQGGTPAGELAHDLGAFCRAAVQLFRIIRRRGVR